MSSSAVSLADSFSLAWVNLQWAVNDVNVKETTDHTPNSLLARRTSRATKLESAGIKRKALQVGQGGGRRGGARERLSRVNRVDASIVRRTHVI